MSTPGGVLRAEMLLRALPHRGLPPRGSFRDLVLQEMLLRERRREISTQIYQAQLLAAGLRMPAAVFNLWTSIYIDEVSHDNYTPRTVQKKRSLLQAFARQKRVNPDMLKRTETYTVRSAKDLKPYTPAELDVIKAKLRRRTISRSQQSP